MNLCALQVSSVTCSYLWLSLIQTVLADLTHQFGNALVCSYCFVLFCSTIQDPSSQILKWRAAPKTVLVIKKIWDDVVDEPFVQLASWLVQV